MDESKIDQWSDEYVLDRHLTPLLKHYDVKWRGHGRLYVDHQRHNIETAQRIVTDLSITLGVSTSEVGSRLMQLNWLKDVRRTCYDSAHGSGPRTGWHVSYGTTRIVTFAR
ncbi:hypothetical protein [Pseudomonas sp. Leaf129]|uniref:hypothetical protein n=1 Tax=Pseudomonas sp. Leaf129 TaxID=1736268 RepID=UPI000A9DB1BE|nr:hypothetical protein [Pseudomonas sp. Leaf129]